MHRASVISVVFAFLLGVLGLSFSIPLHLYPLPNYIEELLVALSVFGAAAALFWRCGEIRLSLCSLLWLVLGGLFLLSALFQPSAFLAGKLAYMLYWFVGALALLIGEQIDWRDEKPADQLAWMLFWCGVIGAVLGGLRHFGLLWEGFDAVIPKVSLERMVGLIGHSNYFAYLCLGSLLSVAWLYQREKVGLTVVLGVGGLLIFCLLLTGSRSVLVAWIGLVAILWGRKRQFYKYLLITSIALLISLALLPTVPYVKELLARLGSFGLLDGRLAAISQRGMDSSGRILEWRIAFDIWSHNPWFGVGVGNYAAASFAEHVRQGVASQPGLFVHSHNSPLQLVVELGVLGLLWIVTAIGAFCIGVWRALVLEGRQLPISVMVIFFIYSFFEFPLWMMHFLVLNLLLVGSLVGSSRVIDVRMGKVFSTVLLLVVTVACIVYVPLVERFYWSFKQYLVRAPVEVREYNFMSAMMRDPLMESAGYMIYFANFQMSPASLPQEREALERLRRFLPYSPLMARLAFVQVAMGDVESGRETAQNMRVFYGPIADRHLQAVLGEAKHSFPDVNFSVLLAE